MLRGGILSKKTFPCLCLHQVSTVEPEKSPGKSWMVEDPLRCGFGCKNSPKKNHTKFVSPPKWYIYIYFYVVFEIKKSRKWLVIAILLMWFRVFCFLKFFVALCQLMNPLANFHNWKVTRANPKISLYDKMMEEFRFMNQSSITIRH